MSDNIYITLDRRVDMKTVHRKTIAFFIVAVLFTFSLIDPGFAGALEAQGDYDSQATFEYAVMTKGRSFTFTAESDTLPNAIIIPLFVIGDENQGSLRVTISKSDSVGDVIALMQYGSGSPAFSSNMGVTPRSITIDPIFYWTGWTVIYAAMLFSPEESGPYRYNVTVRF